MAEQKPSTGQVESRSAIMPKDPTKTRCPNCGRQDKIEVTEKVGDRCYRYICNACIKGGKREFSLITEWVDEIKRAPQYVLDNVQADSED